MANFLRTGVLFAVLTALFMAVGYFIGGTSGMMIAFVVAAGTNLFAYWNSDKMVLSMQGARQVDQRSAPELHAMLERLSRNAGLPTPKLYLIDTQQPNAFATGRNPDNAAVAVSTGLLQYLQSDEVAGVIAHELAHIKNRDTLTMTITGTMAGAISMLAQFGLLFGGGNNRDNPLGGVGALLMVFLAPLAAGIVQMAISRTREYEADKDGAIIARDPMALASALSKISRLSQRTVNVQAERNPAMAHLYIFNPLSGARMDNLFSTHPNVENRIAQLQQIAGQMRRSEPAARVSPQSPRGPAARNSGWRVPSIGGSEGTNDQQRGPWG